MRLRWGIKLQATLEASKAAMDHSSCTVLEASKDGPVPSPSMNSRMSGFGWFRMMLSLDMVSKFMEKNPRLDLQLNVEKCDLVKDVNDLQMYHTHTKTPTWWHYWHALYRKVFHFWPSIELLSHLQSEIHVQGQVEPRPGLKSKSPQQTVAFSCGMLWCNKFWVQFPLHPIKQLQIMECTTSIESIGFNL